MIFELECKSILFSALFYLGPWDRKQCAKFARKRGYIESWIESLPEDIDSEDNDGMNYRPPSSGRSLIWTPGPPENRYQESVLVHEIIHAVQNAMDRIGSNCEELEAHLVGTMYYHAMVLIDKELELRKKNAAANKRSGRKKPPAKPASK